MLNPKYFCKSKSNYSTTVGDVINELSKFDAKAPITVFGNPQFYIHVDDDNTVILDDSTLGYSYPNGKIDVDSARIIGE